ncbi:MAG: cysteine dioxygenase family protein [Actinomycetota bacterium]|nr:cysteine dioxygenase family protein [Actinomycetota bacterium]
MTLTSTDKAAPSSKAAGAGPARACPDSLVRAVRAQVSRGLDWQQTADRVACVLRDNLPDPAQLLPAPLRRGDPACYQSHLLYAEPDGSFSLSAMVWLPGQQTVIHDHVAWCVTGVLQGREYEEIFVLADGGRALGCAGRNLSPAGTVSGFAPPGDIHRVRNTGEDVAISMHVYGADISRLGSSIRREYTLPVLP